MALEASLLSSGCSSDSGGSGGNDDGGDGGDGGCSLPICKKSYTDRFSFTEDRVIDRESALEWDRRADGPRTWDEADRFCTARRMRLPTREELIGISDVLDTGLFPSREWNWSSSRGARADSAWAVSIGGFANANDVRATSFVRCVR